jgi:hypothetical protein
MGLDPLPGTKISRQIQEMPPNAVNALKTLKIKVGGIVSIRESGVLVWERMDGLGDLFAAILRRLNIDKKIKGFIQWITGKSCGCAMRQEWMNRICPFSDRVKRWIRLVIGPKSMLR